MNQETLNLDTFDYDTEAYIVEPSKFSYNYLVTAGISAACKAGRTPREF